MEHFAQTNVFAWICTMFAWMRTVFAHLIIGCAMQYPKIGNLRNVADFGKQVTHIAPEILLSI